MSKRRWTIVVVPQGSSATKIIEISNTALKLVGSLAVAATMLVLLLGYATLHRSLNLVRAERLGYRIMDLPVEWKEDDDSRVKIAKTAWDDLKGIARLRLEFWGLSRPAAPRVVPAVSEPSESVNLTPP